MQQALCAAKGPMAAARDDGGATDGVRAAGSAAPGPTAAARNKGREQVLPSRPHSHGT